MFHACNPTKKLYDGEYLLSKNKVIDSDTKIPKDDLMDYVRPKPNYKLLGLFRFHLWLHNSANEERIERKRNERNIKHQQKNDKRIAKGKKAKKDNHQLFGEWLLSRGEAPVIYDSLSTDKSAEQIHFFLKGKGHFVSSVSDSVRFKKNGKAIVYYTVKATPAYKVNSIDYTFPGDYIKPYIIKDTINSLVKVGNNFDVDVLKNERERIASILNNQGYYKFTKKHVYFSVDTINTPGKVAINIALKNYSRKISPLSDSTIDEPHKQYFINNIYVNTAYSINQSKKNKLDTIHANNCHFVYAGDLNYKTKILAKSIVIFKDEVYQHSKVQNTYKLLSQLNAFKYIHVSFTELGANKLNCHIDLSPATKQSITMETEGTSTPSDLGVALGVSGSVVYQNKNLFKGAEMLELKLKGGFLAQRALNDSTQTSGNNTPAFNTVEYGPELNLFVPRFLLPFKVEATKLASPKTVFTNGLNYQRRPDYMRIITKFSLAYVWNESARKLHSVTPFTIDFVKVDLQEDFENTLNSINNLFIQNSFNSHLTTSFVYTFTYNEQDLNGQKSFSFFRGTFESSGNALRGLYALANRIEPNTFIKDDKGRYTFLDIAYSQFIKADADYRYYWDIHDLGQVVFRIAMGIGKPLDNFDVLPFEKSYSGGGVNSLRAWQAMTLGPGSYYNNTFSFDQFGDGRLEANVEHRFKIFRLLNGAVFIDAGNIWLERPDATRPGGEFKLDRFYEQIAIGSGFGARLDFNFFIVRFDLGIKVRDPQFSDADRWVIKHWFSSDWKNSYNTTNGQKYNFTTFNLGVGYPF